MTYRNFLITVLVLIFSITIVTVSYAGSSKDLLKQGLLGAGAGAAGSAAGGGNAGTGALVGAGVNILGGALLDSMTESDSPRYPERRDDYGYRQSSQRTYRESAPTHNQAGDAYSTGYEDGYSNGYKAGYSAGYKEGLKEAYKEQAN